MQSHVQAIGFAGALLVFLAFWMKSMVPLRLIAIGSNIAFIAYGVSVGAAPVWMLHAALLPMNLLRLLEIWRLSTRVCRVQGQDAALRALLLLMTPAEISEGSSLFRQGDDADALYYIDSGEVEIVDLGLRFGDGDFVGVVGVLAPSRRRSVSAVARTDCRMLVLSADKAVELALAKPEVGLALARLATERLMQSMALSRRAPLPAPDRRPDAGLPFRPLLSSARL